MRDRERERNEEIGSERNGILGENAMTWWRRRAGSDKESENIGIDSKLWKDQWNEIFQVFSFLFLFLPFFQYSFLIFQFSSRYQPNPKHQKTTDVEL